MVKSAVTQVSQNPHGVFWFRQDLRLADNQAFTAACEWVKQQQSSLTAIYIATPRQWESHDVAPMQLDFIERHVNLLAQGLASLGIAFELIQLDTFEQVPDFLTRYCQQRAIGQVFAGSEPEYNERMRDEACLNAGVPLTLTEEHCLLPPLSVLNLAGEMYKVFTPFSRKWRELAARRAIYTLPVPAPLSPVLPMPAPISFTAHTVSSAQWAAGEGQAKRLLQDFIKQKVQDYKQDRDFPAIEGTSHLSPYLALGVLSPRQCVAALLQAFPEVIVEDTSPARTWLNELIWREFYRHLLVAFPSLSKNHNFNRQADALEWRNDPQEFAAWCEGRTGYPIVDAAMRQLNQTGWMHNRLRMVVASFLTKHLLIDWRWGERYFRQHLIDGDLSANNGGWQWSAGCGCDAQPYFRIFNPMNQSEKFDPDGSFIRKYIPEIASWSIKQLHLTAKTSSFEAQGSHVQGDLLTPAVNEYQRQCAYPAPIVEHSAARVRALTVLGVMKKG